LAYCLRHRVQIFFPYFFVISSVTFCVLCGEGFFILYNFARAHL